MQAKYVVLKDFFLVVARGNLQTDFGFNKPRHDRLLKFKFILGQ